MSQDDELTRGFPESGGDIVTGNAPAGTPTVRRRRPGPALVAGAAAVAVLALGGTWLGLHRDGWSAAGTAGASSGPAVPGGVATPTMGPSESAAGPPSGVGVAGGGGSAAALPRCHTGDLGASLQGAAGGGAAGSVYLDLGLTNRSAHPCGLYGFPGMTLIDSAGQWLPTRVGRDSTRPALVTLPPGGTGWALVRYTHVPADDESVPCLPSAAGLAVTPPDETTQLTVNAKLEDVCQHGQLSTSVMAAQRSGG
jgi:hypothetical protein